MKMWRRRESGAGGGRVWGVLLSFVAVAALNGCGPGVGLYRLPEDRVQAQSLEDEKDFQGLAEAVHQSIRYFRARPDTAVFHYGDLTYSAREMEGSMLLFLDIVENLEGRARQAALREKFHFFESRNDRGEAFFTGYYEPVLPGSLHPAPEFTAPLYAVPEDLVTVDLAPYMEIGLLPDTLDNRRLKGRLRGRTVVPYDDREQITGYASLEGRAEILLYLPDQIELFFLQIQGSGLVRLADGTFLRVNYADQNGHPYRAIGRDLLDRIPREKMSLQAIRKYLYDHPEEVRDILNSNPSYTFFRHTVEGPLGLLGVPLTPGRSVAMDSRLLPRGGLVFFETTYPAQSVDDDGPLPFARFGVVQDTGGAIRGHGRADIFWGRGKEAERIAGPMKEPGRIFLLVARKEYL